MFKRFSLPLIATAFLLTAACASKKTNPDADKAQAGTEETGKMDPNVKTKDIAYDQKGSDGGGISGLVSVHFDYDSSTLSSETRKQLAENAEWIKNNPGPTVQIEGHCDSRGSVEYNLALGERRAKSVKNFLVSLGIDSKRLTIISYGEEKPLDTADTEQAYAKNRRANFVPLAQ
jgi:peptidoglycan-associated lipoprotein